MKALMSQKIRRIAVVDFGFVEPQGGEFIYEPKRKVISHRLKNIEIDYNLNHVIWIQYY